MANTKPNFGLYLFQCDGKTGRRYPLYDDPNMWDVMARPLKARPEPPVTQSPAVSGDEQSFVLGALNVYESSVFKNLPPRRRWSRCACSRASPPRRASPTCSA